jgi:hypothetical protein
MMLGGFSTSMGSGGPGSWTIAAAAEVEAAEGSSDACLDVTRLTGLFRVGAGRGGASSAVWDLIYSDGGGEGVRTGAGGSTPPCDAT